MKFPLYLLFLPVAGFGQAVRLQTEYLTNPIGLDALHPRLSWQLSDSRPGARQSAYQLIAGTDSAEVAAGKGSVWQTGKVLSDRNRVSYAGKTLLPFTKYFWKVSVWDKDGKVLPGGSVASFETGNGNEWKGAWISDSRDVKTRPAPYFRKTFDTKKKIRSARAYIAAGGLYELFLNGEKIGNHRLDPMYTRFDRRTLYVTYDVTRQLKEGKNAVGVLLGNGWYNHQSTAVWYFHEAPWRNRPAFCLDLRVTYEDGTTETISTDKTWKTALSPIIFNSIYTAEHCDSRKELPGWNTASFDDKGWKEVIYRAAPSTHVVAQALHPIRNVEEVRTRNLTRLNDTTWVFDLGRTISGVSRFRVSGPAGSIIRLKHAERLYPDGRADMSNIDVHYRPTDDTDPFQTDIFILNGKGEQSFMPSFSYKGFQYVEVTAPRETELRPENLTGYFMHSDVPAVGTVRSSNPTLDKIWWATNNSYLSNLFGYPTDCPQREKNGWTGDAHIAVETGLYSFDGITVYEKWLGDHRDEQQPNGVLPAIIPTSGWGYEWANGPDWTSTIALIPWNLYLFYGDTQPLADNYDNLRRYVDHIADLAPDGLTSWGLGDWVPVKSKSPVELTSSVYYFVDATILARAAGILGKTADQVRYAALAEKIRQAVNAKYLNRETGMYGSGLQTELSVPLQWGLVPEELKAKVAANLAKRVEADGKAIDVGLLGTKAILNALSENGYADLAYALASRETFPSWGWWIKNGATTLYENWPIDAKSDISLNHIMFGEIGAWIYKGLGGIKPDPQHPGFRNVLLEPNFVSGLEHFEAQHEGPYGTIRSAWKRTGTAVSYDVSIPANSTATLTLRGKKRILQDGREQKPDAQGKLRLMAGTYHFTVE
ncbi:alpha-L-rhamnosidase [Siphonobacter aquaeclarae]|uniref:alpha-L-rhamnosidase n=1 Tax=Siphonobacter aquaeclarae TaxID=563176 RepID=A0A1G9JU47_9BACT|nr:alpha-L-rhamnosidase [Siphonobacter aquaeclarae]SDL40786.1 alpha-L-rhamnosidase [Siphonobacter aquaeclarae]